MYDKVWARAFKNYVQVHVGVLWKILIIEKVFWLKNDEYLLCNYGKIRAVFFSLFRP